MSKRLRQHLDRRGLSNVAPEYLLLLTIFGGDEMQRRVEAELDRRAARRPIGVRPALRLRPLQPAA